MVGLVDESYKDGSGSEHGIYETYKLALYLYALQATPTNIAKRRTIILTEIECEVV